MCLDVCLAAYMLSGVCVLIIFTNVEHFGWQDCAHRSCRTMHISQLLLLLLSSLPPYSAKPELNVARNTLKSTHYTHIYSYYIIFFIFSQNLYRGCLFLQARAHSFCIYMYIYLDWSAETSQTYTEVYIYAVIQHGSIKACMLLLISFSTHWIHHIYDIL